MRIITISKWVFICISLVLLLLMVYFSRRKDAKKSRLISCITGISSGLIVLFSVIETLLILQK